MSDELAQTVVVVVSKSGGRKETRNGMLEAEVKFKETGLQFNKYVLRHLASNDSHLRVLRGDEPADDQFSYAG